MSEVVTELADPAANIIFGAVVDEKFEGKIHVTIIATGFPTEVSLPSLLAGAIGGGKAPAGGPKAGGPVRMSPPGPSWLKP